MLTVNLFGAALDVTSGTGQVGDAVQVTLALNTSKNRLTVGLDGQWGIARFRQVQLNLAVTLLHSRLSIDPQVSHATAGELVITVGANAHVIRLPKAQTASDYQIGIDLFTAGGDTLGIEAAKAVTALFPNSVLWTDGQWRDSAIAFDHRDQSIAFRPQTGGGDRPSCIFADRFYKDPSPIGKKTRIEVRQKLPLHEVRCIAQTFSAFFELPANSQALLIQPEILDPRAFTGSDENAFQYQFGLTGGEFAIDSQFAGGQWTAEDGRFESRGTGMAQVALLAIRDEQGHPLVLEANRFPIVQRTGSDSGAPPGSPTHIKWSQTNSAVALGANAGSETRVMVCAMDPIALYGRDRRAPRIDAVSKLLLDPPYWVEGGRIPVLPTGPRSIHGIARNVSLAWATNDTPLPLPAVLRAIPQSRNGRTIDFLETTIGLPAGRHRLEAKFAEHSTFASYPGKTSVPVRKREARSNGDNLIEFPIIDTAWSFANLAGRPTNGQWSQVGNGWIAEKAGAWLDGSDARLINAFHKPAAQAFEHVAGHRSWPAESEFARLIAPAPATTIIEGEARAAPTASREPVLRLGQSVAAARSAAKLAVSLASPSPRTSYLFGGHVEGFAQPASLFSNTLDDEIESLLRRLCGLDIMPGESAADWWATLNILRDVLGPVAELAWTNDDPTEAEELAAGALLNDLQRLFTDLATQGLAGEFAFAEMAETVDSLSPDELVTFWNLAIAGPADSFARNLIGLHQAPPTLETARRAVAAIANPRLTQAAIPANQYRILTSYFLPTTLVNAVKSQWTGIADSLDGFLATVTDGIDSIFEQAQILWKDQVLEPLRRKYGPALTDQVYQALLENPADADVLLEFMRSKGFPLWRLADLLCEPPDYLLVTRRFRRPDRDQAGDDSLRLHPADAPGATSWSGRYDFCRMGGSAWDFFLDDTSTVLVKLGERRGLADVLKDAHDAYRSEQRPDPLAVPFEGETPEARLAALISDLPAEILERGWRGVLVINPSLDLDRDQTLKTLCGFTYMKALWGAIGGRKPEFGASIETWGHVKRIVPANDSKVKDGAEQHDVRWSLTTFDVTVRGTQILAGEIAFLLKVHDLFGAQDRNSWPDIEVRASLPPATGGDAQQPRSFVFEAAFKQILPLEVDLAFLERIDLRTIKVGSHQGDVTLDIDADLILRDPQWGSTFDFIPEGPFRLEDFRIRIPPLPDGEAIAMGAMRALKFDLPAIRFPAIQPRQLKLFGVEITPVGVGIRRGTPADVKAQVESGAFLIGKSDFGTSARITLPYLELTISFGGLPVFGGGTQLELQGLLGVAIEEGSAKVKDPVFAISAASGRDVKIDLFRILTLTIKELAIGRYERRSPPAPLRRLRSRRGAAQKQVGVLLAKEWDLKICNWSFLKDYSKDLLLAHDMDDAGHRGLLAMATRRSAAMAPAAANDSFFQLEWMLLARHLDIGSGIKEGLLDRSGDDESQTSSQVSVVESVFPDKSPRILYADFTGGWLFGIRFKLGDLFQYCTLVLDDGHFYGIGLKAAWLEAVAGVDELTFAYIPGPKPSKDKFRTSLRIAALGLIAQARSGLCALEWSPDWDFLIDLGFPWHGPDGYDWHRAFSIPMGGYEAKFGLFIQKSSTTGDPSGHTADTITLAAGFGFYYGYFFEADYGIAWVRAGIGIFGILSGSVTLRLAKQGTGSALSVLQGSLVHLEIVGALGIFAYGEGGVEVWILSARFRVSAQASITITLTYRPNQTAYIAWDAELRAAYSASVRVGSGWFSWTFSVSGSCGIGVHGQTALG